MQNQRVSEGDEVANICVTRTGKTSLSYNFTLQSIDDGTADKLDFLTEVYNFTFAPDADEVCHEFSVFDDTLALENDEVFSIHLLTMSSLLNMTTSSANVVIVDNDGNYLLINQFINLLSIHLQVQVQHLPVMHTAVQKGIMSKSASI